MKVSELVEILQKLDQNRRVVVADRDGASRAEDVEFVDQRVDRGENVISIWYHK